MADIKKIKVGNTAYDIRDATAARSNHTHSFDTITNRGEAFLSWGGKNFSGTYGPIDAAMVPELGANRLAFMPADAVTIEYSRDGGSTWTDYGPTDPQKSDLFNGRGSSFTIGKATSGAGNIATNKYQLRVNIYTSAGKVYTALNKFVIYLSTSGTNNNWCTIRARTQSDYTAGNDKWTTFADKISVSGWSGYNVINTSGITTYGNTASSQYGHIQFIFGCDTGSTNNSYPGLQINKIFGFGGVGWTTPSTMAKTGHMYTYDSSQNVTFPAGVSAKSFTENGKTLSATYIAKSLTSAKGDMIYASAASTPARLGIGSNGQFLSVADGAPKWVNNPNTDTHYTNYLQIKGNGTEAVKFTQNVDKTLNLKQGNNVSISAASGEITISATNTHNSHAIISGTKADNSTQIKGSASSGDITLGDSGVTAGTYRSVTVNSKGIVVAGSSADTDTNTWRKVQLNGTDKLGTGTNTNPLNIKAGSNMTITESNGTFTFAATDTNTDTKVTAVGNHYKPANGTNLTVSSSGTASRGSTKVLTNVAIDAAGHVTGGTWCTLPSSDDTDTKNTAGATDSVEKLYLVGAKNQDANPQTYSNSKVYMTDGTLTTNSITTDIVRSSNSNVTIQTISPDGNLHGVAFFSASSSNGTSIEAQGHLTVWGNDDNDNPYKPLNRTGFSDLDTYYFNTGITLRDVNGTGIQSYYQLAFPTTSGTLSTIKYKHNIVLSGSFSGGPGGSVYCTFSFINNGPSAISDLNSLASALAINFNNKICPACGLFGYDYSGSGGSLATLKLITGVIYNSNAVQIYYVPIASTSSNTMTIDADPSTSASGWSYPINSATITDTVEEC